VALRDQFAPDLRRVFINTDEHGTFREFRINDGQGGFKLFTAPVVWDEEAAKATPIVEARSGAVVQADVICYIEHTYLPRPPMAGEIIYSPANQPWEVLKVTDEEYCWMLALGATRSHPAFFGPAQQRPQFHAA
jgi:hypothetical protein